MNPTLRVLLNTPPFIGLMFKLGNGAHSQSITDTTVQAQQNLFYTFLEIMQTAYAPNQNENTAVQLVQSFGVQYEALYSPINDWIKQDSAEFYLYLMNVFKLMLIDANQEEWFSKALAIKSFFIDVNNGQLKIAEEHAIQISSNIDGFVECINNQYSYVHTQDHSGNLIQQDNSTLPEQIVLIDNRPEKDSHIPYPIEFDTRHGQRYLLTGAVASNATYSNDGNHVAMILRQNSVYLLNYNRLIDWFHLQYLSEYFASVIFISSIKIRLSYD